MWDVLSKSGKDEYKRLILAFASLTEMFAQKVSNEGEGIAPIINSKYQETAFQRAFNAAAEDIGNTSYDVSLQYEGEKYLIGIKTFGIASGDQKVAQFKAKHDEWAEIIDEIKTNASSVAEKDEIDKKNESAYLRLARAIASIRNQRIDSSYANIRGFRLDVDDKNVHSVYHVLMPSSKTEDPKIYVGEISYDKININKLQILGCTGKKNPTNFTFTDGNHTYKYTSADSQLHMSFNNREIVCDEWDVRYADDAYAIFGKIADLVYPSSEQSSESKETEQNREDFQKVGKVPVEEYCWTIWNKEGEAELYSGFNSFYGIGSKMGMEQRKKRIARICEAYSDKIEEKLLYDLRERLNDFLLEPATTSSDKAMKSRLRNYIVQLTKETGNSEFADDVVKIIYRPMDEMYIPIPNSTEFHKKHPNFFGKDYGKLIDGSSKLALPKDQRRFNLIFEPSGDSLPAYITQDQGKAIESAEKQSYLGEWILRGVFQLKEYEPLTSKKMKELNINGLRFFKYGDSDDVHVEFIWIDEENPPKGYIART